MAEKLFLREREFQQLGLSEENIRTLRKLTEFVNTQTRLIEAETDIDQAQTDITAIGSDVDAIQAQFGTDHRTVTANTTIEATDSVIFVDASGGPVTVTFPALSERQFHVKKIDSSSNAVTLDAGSETIDGGATAILTVPYECVTVGGFSSGWFIL